MNRLDKNLLDQLCLEFNFTYDVIGIFIRIKSKLGTYYILDQDTEGRPFKLYHANLFGSAGMHSHGKHTSLRNVMLSIKKHDGIYKPGSRNNVCTRMNNIFDKLHKVG